MFDGAAASLPCWGSFLKGNWSLQRLAHNELTLTPLHRLKHSHILPWTKTNTSHCINYDQPYPLGRTLCLLHTLQILILTSLLDYYKGETEPRNPISLHYVGLQNHNINHGAPKDLGTLYHNIENTLGIEKPCIKPKHRLSHRGRL